MPPGGIRTHNRSKRAAADPHLRPRGHRNQQPRLLMLLKRKVRIPGNCQGTADGVWRSEVTDLPILNLRIRWEVCVIFLHVPAALNQAERHQYPPNWMLDGPLGWYGRFEISCPHWMSNHGSSAFHPVGQFKFVNYYNE